MKILFSIWNLTFGLSLCCTVPSSPFNGLSFYVNKLRLASALLLSQQPAPNFSKSVKLNAAHVPTKTRTFVPDATQATAPRAAFVPPRPSSCRPGSPGCSAASGRPPSHASRRAAALNRGPWPGPQVPRGASLAVPPAGPGGSEETPAPSRSNNSGPRGWSTDAPGELAAQPRARRPSRSPNTAGSALRRTRPPPRRGHVEPAGRGAPGAGGGWFPGRTEVRQGSGQRGDAASPGAREGLTDVTETPR